MKIILLPGLDGTGQLFQRLSQHLPAELDIEIVSYDAISAFSYSNQANELADRFKDGSIFIVAESYSGPVAYKLYQLMGPRVKGILFLASFITKPSWYSCLAFLFPVSFIKPTALNRRLLYQIGFNSLGGFTIVDAVFKSIKCANRQKLKARLKNIAFLKRPNKKINCPVTYIQPSKDSLINSNCIDHIELLSTQFKRVQISGGHFIAQSNPVECAAEIKNALFNIN